MSCRSWESLLMASVGWQQKKLKQDDCLSKTERNFFVESSCKKVPLIPVILKFYCVFSSKVPLATNCVPERLSCFRAMQLEWQNLASALPWNALWVRTPVSLQVCAELQVKTGKCQCCYAWHSPGKVVCPKPGKTWRNSLPKNRFYMKW